GADGRGELQSLSAEVHGGRLRVHRVPRWPGNHQGDERRGQGADAVCEVHRALSDSAARRMGEREEATMATVAAPVQKQWTLADFLYRITVAEYRRMAELGILTENHDVELLEGLLVTKMTRNPPHDGSLLLTQTELQKVLPAGWVLRIQSSITLA